MIQVAMMLGLFGGLFGGGADDCSQSAAQAQRAIERVERQWPVRASTDPVSGYVNSLGLRLSRFEPMADHPRVLVLQNLQPMAFALGGGRFVVSDGLIAMVRDESQLAAVIAHEFAHQRLGHFCRRESGSDSRIKIGSIVQHFDLQLEIEADLAAVDTLGASGFDPGAMSGILQCLAEQGIGGALLWERIDVLYGRAGQPTSAPPAASIGFREARDHIRQQVGDLTGDEIPNCP